MSTLTRILERTDNNIARQLIYLINIVKKLGWETLDDTRTIKPNLRAAQVYMHKNADFLHTLFGVSFHNIRKPEVVDAINPILINMWHVQIIGSPEMASLQLLQKHKK